MAEEKRQYPQWVETPLGIVAVLEFIALLIALATPITPSKTGSKGDMADYFFTDPSYLEKVFVAFIGTNIVIAILAIIVFISVRVSRNGSSRET